MIICQKCKGKGYYEDILKDLAGREANSQIKQRVRFLLSFASFSLSINIMPIKCKPFVKKFVNVKNAYTGKLGA